MPLKTAVFFRLYAKLDLSVGRHQAPGSQSCPTALPLLALTLRLHTVPRWLPAA